MAFFLAQNQKEGERKPMKKLILRLLLDDIGFIFLFILSAYYSRWAIYKILPAFFNATSQMDSLLIGLGIVLLFMYILLCAWSICKSIGYCIKAIRDFRNQTKSKRKD